MYKTISPARRAPSAKMNGEAMNLALSEAQDLLKRNARDFLAEQSPASLVKALMRDPLGYSESLWRGMADLGWPGLLIAEQYGGLGGSVVDACVLFEEIGRVLAPTPLFTSSILAAEVILACGSEEQQQRLLPEIAAGQCIAALAYTEPSDCWDPADIEVTARQDGEAYVLNGIKLFVADAHIADPLIVVGRQEGTEGTDGLVAVMVERNAPGLTLTPLEPLSGEKQFEITLENVRGEALGNPPSGWGALDSAFERATIVKCAEMLGSSQKALEMAVEYSKVRIAFGRPIGSFQAIQHKAADMVTGVDALRVMVYEAAWKLDEGIPASLDISLAKDYANIMFRHVTVEAHQIFAGIGATMDHDLHLYFRRVRGSEMLLGDSEYHQERVAVALDL
jgi:alkylation response protein AidB-like acyl-CoA dehydrogenase